MNRNSPFETFYKHLKTVDGNKMPGHQFLSRLNQIFRQAIVSLTDSSTIQFTTFFARMSYLSSAYSLDYNENYVLHSFRKLTPESIKAGDRNGILIGKIGINILCEKCFGEDPIFPLETRTALNELIKEVNREQFSYLSDLRVIIKDIDLLNKRIYVQEENEPFDSLTISYGRSDRNEDYTGIFTEVKKFGFYPLYCRLLDIEIDSNQVYYPSSFVFEPDLLYDVTAISECFGPFSTNTVGYLLRRFAIRISTLPLLIGNLSNYFLDQLIYYPDIELEQIKKELFQLYPLSLALFDDTEIRQLLTALERHFSHIKKVVKKDLAQLGLNKKNSYIEPTFYSARYGIQGRLDLFSYSKDTASIVELKSGAPFRPNAYGMSNNHYHQTLLYDMLIESVFGNKLKRSNFLLYSREEVNQLRFAPTIKSEQREALKIRNQLYLLDKKLEKTSDMFAFLKEIEQNNDSALKGYLKTDIRALVKLFGSLDSIENAYCTESIQFVIREQMLSKLGDETKERNAGLASLWRQQISEKKDQFTILNHLEIIENRSMNSDPVMVLQKSPLTARLSNFRVGDLAVFYPDQNRTDSILHHQVFKCTIVKIAGDYVKVRLRSKQENPLVFQQNDYWNIEHDFLENGFYAMTRSIIEFARAESRTRGLLLSSIKPVAPTKLNISKPDILTDEQYQIFKEIIGTKDYYLLWGPPGTGKTSILFREVVRYLLSETTDRMLLMAYTNRAVDEMCKALLAISETLSFVRIGSRYSTSELYKSYLLNEQIALVNRRTELNKFLSEKRIYVGTVSSLMGKTDLFKMINFDYAIVDEASQILEPALIGLLSKVKRYVLIGDHLQLPAIVLQKSSESEIKNEALKKAGFTNFSNSMFERMYTIALANNWSQVIGNLTYQGRMHRDLVTFPNENFYNEKLKLLPGLDRLVTTRNLKGRGHVQKAIVNHRKIFIPSSLDMVSDSIKVNEDEARKVVEIVSAVLSIYKENKVRLHSESIGVVTPFRAQIARILQLLVKEIGPITEDITVDTVERYQGGARDIIIFSTTLNYTFQLDSLISHSDDGIDRKLNVAYTRAREQFIIIGNENILSTNETYRHLLKKCNRLEIS